MSDLRFIEQLRAEFERIAADPVTQRRGRSRLARRGGWRPPSGGSARIAVAGAGLALSVLVVAVVVAVALLGAHARGPSAPTTTSERIVFRALSLDRRPVTGPAIDRSVDIARSRLVAAFGAAQVLREGNDVVVTVRHPAAGNRARVERLVGTVGRLEFYDWEANALTRDGKPVARALQARDQNALTISQGLSSGPGASGSGSMPLYEAVTLASRQPKQVSHDNARPGPQYFMFGRSGSAACAAAAKAGTTSLSRGSHCLLSGPDDNLQDLYSGLPPGTHPADEGVQTLTVPQGTVVLQAAQFDQAQQVPFDSPLAQFYVLRDHAALSSSDITRPQPGSDPSGQPDVTFGFTAQGGKAFQAVTAAIARRGDRESALGQSLNQHFAVALDNKLITVPSIDFKSYPNGIPSGNGADIVGGFGPLTARDLAILLRFGPLPAQLASP